MEEPEIQEKEFGLKKSGALLLACGLIIIIIDYGLDMNLYVSRLFRAYWIGLFGVIMGAAMLIIGFQKEKKK